MKQMQGEAGAEKSTADKITGKIGDCVATELQPITAA